ncbi:protein of unknown function (plasmid) [Cupriavidus taiwanensis]|nr:protein of unknown function [Cupriavidus taiwanensis]SPA03292.1 protein of unknown function [Cupriavidus taiwanensis]SPA11267.1 protein of unknown function [Cupriavidus taiwanensis]
MCHSRIARDDEIQSAGAIALKFVSAVSATPQLAEPVEATAQARFAYSCVLARVARRAQAMQSPCLACSRLLAEGIGPLRENYFGADRLVPRTNIKTGQYIGSLDTFRLLNLPALPSAPGQSASCISRA